MEIITITSENIEKEHICCAISNNNDCQVASKKAWMRERFADGLVFKKGDVRGKCFIEYIPAEKAFAPIAADGYMYINCLWVAGQFKGHGYAAQLLDACIADSRKKGKKGLVVLSSKKKMGFLSDPDFLSYKGFVVADEAEPYFRLMALPFSNDTPLPAFTSSVKNPPKEDGLVLYYTSQCPFNAKYVPILTETAKNNGVTLKTVRIDCAGDAKNAPSPFTTFSLFYRGKFLTHEMQSAAKFEKILATLK